MISHLNTLHQRHLVLEHKIQNAINNKLDQPYISSLKKQKLLLKEKIFALSSDN